MEAKEERKGKVQTVLGLISPEELGITLPHEHCLIDLKVWFREPADEMEKKLAYQPITLENTGWVRTHFNNNLDNLSMVEEDVAVEELKRFKQAGGNTLADVTPIGLSRDPSALVRISKATGLNIIMGSGYYVGSTPEHNTEGKTEEELAEEIMSDVLVGVGDTGVRAGIIGEIGCSWPLQDSERKMLCSSARAQQMTGAALSIHPGRNIDAYYEVLEIVEDAGADLSRTILCHIDRAIFDHKKRLAMAEKCAERGCYLEYDTFGHESYMPLSLNLPNSGVDYIGDHQRILDIFHLIDKGYLEQILISQDCCFKTKLSRYGGFGYAHILNNVVPRMRDDRMNEESMHTLLYENPKAILTLV